MSKNTAVSPPSTMLERLRAERQTCVDFIDQTIAGANVEGQTRDLSKSEKESLTRTRGRIEELDEQIAPLEEFEQLRSAGNAAAANYRPTAAGTPGAAPPAGGSGAGLGAHVEQRAWHYPSAGHAIVDQLRAAPQSMGGRSDADARDRLLSAGVLFAGVTDEQANMARSNAHRLASETRATQVTADTPGVLPVPIIGEVMSDVDAARPFITSVGAKALDFAGETFKRPVVTQHTVVSQQTTEATTTGMGSQKLTIAGVEFSKETWGGYLDVSRQDIDWTSPAAWNAILTDLEEQYSLTTENAAADAFATAVTASVEVDGTGTASTLQDWLRALYSAAALAYAGAGRLPDKIWVSLDMWGELGAIIESQVATNQSPGSSRVGAFTGMLSDLPRVVVPSLASGTVIIGSTRWTEVYEERIGLLQAVLPSVLGVQVAYGGYVAYNTLKAGAFAKVVNAL